MSIEIMFKDSLIIRSRDGSERGPFRGGFNGNSQCTVFGPDDVSEGDCVERTLPNGRVERFIILDAHFRDEFHGIPANWRLDIRKETSLKETSKRVTNNISIGTANAVQVGDHNTQEVSSVFQSVVTAIEQSNATPAEKAEAKGLLQRFLKHPATVAAMGAGAAAAVKAAFGG